MTASHHGIAFILSLVPLIISNTDLKLKTSSDYDASLCDVASTVLDVMGIEPAKEMTGRSLLLR